MKIVPKLIILIMYQYFFKRFFDFWIALIALIIISPILIIVTIWLHFANKGAGTFFYQERPGKDEKIFKVIKFKTMTDEVGDNGEALPDAQRLTKVGKFVRSTSLDELPQLINVLKGDMALLHGATGRTSQTLGRGTYRDVPGKRNNVQIFAGRGGRNGEDLPQSTLPYRR